MFQVWHNYFTDPAVPFREIDAAGLVPQRIAVTPEGLLDQPHGHPFPVWFYITGGSIRIRDEEQGVTHDLHPGCMVKVTAGHRHSEELVHYEVIVATEAGALPAVTV